MEAWTQRHCDWDSGVDLSRLCSYLRPAGLGSDMGSCFPGHAGRSVLIRRVGTTKQAVAQSDRHQGATRYAETGSLHAVASIARHRRLRRGTRSG